MGAKVTIDTRIGIDGFTKDFRQTSPADPDFVNALVDAVKQWQFSQTKLDCVPVEVTMHVTASFVAQLARAGAECGVPGAACRARCGVPCQVRRARCGVACGLHPAT